MSTLDGDIESLAAESRPTLEHEASGETYTIRRFRDEDKQGFLDLFETTGFDLGGTEAWFDWKFRDNPYLAHTPVFVAEHDGDVVGARPFIAFRLRAGPRTVVGIQTADTMVHPDHRSRGIFSRMNDLAFAFYRQREPALMFSIPNERSRPAYLDMGARVVSPIRSYLRLNRPSRFVDEKLGSWTPAQTEQLLDKIAGGYLSVRDQFHNGKSAGELSVNQYATVPTETFTTLGNREIPDEIHAYRDKQFYEWRYENPEWEYESFVATRNGDPIAGVITGTRAEDDRVTTRICDAVPLAGSERRAGFAAALSRVLKARSESDVITASGTSIPGDLLAQFGFQPDDELPLSPFTNQTVLISMPLEQTATEATWQVEGRDISDPNSWQFPFCLHNTS